MTVVMKDVYSSNIDSVGFDEKINELYVRFKGAKSVYIYSEVPAVTYSNLMAADSLGSWLHNNIKNKFKFRKVDDAPTENF